MFAGKLWSLVTQEVPMALIVVLEDDSMVRKVVTTALTSEGHTVVDYQDVRSLQRRT